MNARENTIESMNEPAKSPLLELNIKQELYVLESEYQKILKHFNKLEKECLGIKSSTSNNNYLITIIRKLEILKDNLENLNQKVKFVLDFMSIRKNTYEKKAFNSVKIIYLSIQNKNIVVNEIISSLYLQNEKSKTVFEYFEKKSYEELEKNLYTSKDPNKGINLLNEKCKEINFKKQEIEVSFQIASNLKSLSEEIKSSLDSQGQELSKIELQIEDDNVSLLNQLEIKIDRNYNNNLKFWIIVMLASFVILIICMYLIKSR